MLLVFAFWGCSKAKIVSGGSDSKNRWLTVGSAWLVDTLDLGDSAEYLVEVTAGKTYRVQWDDFFNGTDVYSGDIMVQALDSSGDSEYWKEDKGYIDVRTLNANSGELQIHVQGLDSGNFAIRVVEYDASLLSSSSALNSSSSFYSSSAAISSGAVLSSSSISVVVGDTLPISRSWTLGHLAYLDTNVYVVPSVLGKTYRVQWMDAYSYIASQLPVGVYPSGDVEVTALSGSGLVVFGPYGDGIAPYSINGYAPFHLKVAPNYSNMDTGSYFIRVYDNYSVRKNLAASEVWTEDSSEIAGDTVVYRTPVVPGKNYRVQWNDVNGSGAYATGDISVALGYGDSVYASASPLDEGYGTVRLLTATQNYMRVRSVSSVAGKYAIRVFEQTYYHERTIQPSDLFRYDSLAYLDTFVYKVPVVPGSRYAIQMDDYGDGTLLSSANARLTYKNQTDLTWSAWIGACYTTPILVTPTQDTMLVKITGLYSYTVGSFGIRVYAKPPLLEKTLAMSRTWTQDTLGSGDTIIYKIPTGGDTLVRIQWNDAGQGNSTKTANLYLYYKDKSASAWTGEYYTGYSDLVAIHTHADTLLVKMRAETTSGYGSFAIRVYNPSRIIKSGNIGMTWVRDTVDVSDTLFYKVGVVPGKTYRIQWADRIDYPNNMILTGNVSAQVFSMNNLRYWTSVPVTGFSLNQLVTPIEDSMLVAIINTETQVGSFLLRVLDDSLLNVVRTIPVDTAWTVDTVLAGDTMKIHVPTVAGQRYLIQVDDAIIGSGQYSGSTVFSYQLASGTTAGWGIQNSVSSLNLYGLGYVINGTGDSLWISMMPTVASKAGGFGFRIIPLNGIPLTVGSGLYNPYTIGNKEYQLYKAYVTKGTTYSINWRDYTDGTGLKTAYIKVSVLDRTLLSGNSYYYGATSGYSTTRSFVPREDSVYVFVETVSSIGGTYSLRIQ